MADFVYRWGGFPVELSAYSVRTMPLDGPPDDEAVRRLSLQEFGFEDEQWIELEMAEKRASYQVQCEWATQCPFEVTVYIFGSRHTLYGDDARRYLALKGTLQWHLKDYEALFAPVDT